jgi:pimeloyl-ACP methyl ester carboxylesterase
VHVVEHEASLVGPLVIDCQRAQTACMGDAFAVRYAQSGDLSIAWHAVGSGPPDLVLTPGAASHLEIGWEFGPQRRFIERLASFARVIRFDKRGTGMSDRVGDRLPTLEERVDDIRAVSDAAGVERGILVGVSDGGAMSAFFAATHADRLSGLVLVGAEAHVANPMTDDEIAAANERVRLTWGTEEGAQRSLAVNAPDHASDPEWVAWMMRHQRMGASPGAVAMLARMNRDLDIRSILPAVQVPTLVIHRRDDRNIPVEQARLIARLIPGARLAELPGNAHFMFAGDMDAIADEIEEFVTGERDPGARNRILATVVFTDIVDSTALALERGDRAWRTLLEQHHAIVRRELQRYRGREIDTAGDGFLSSFDGPARGVRFARAVTERLAVLGLRIRAGVHTGECELHDGKLAGVAVHIGARVAALADSGEVLVSGTVRDLVAGSGLDFEDRGEHVLRGIPEARRVYALRA